MTDEQIGLLLGMGSAEARLLLENGERALYKRIQGKMVKLVREYRVNLPLNCLQFVYWENRFARQNKHSYRMPKQDFLGRDNL
jgi:hypothetical protein